MSNKIMRTVYSQACDKIGRKNRKIFHNESKNLLNHQFSIFSQNCIGSIIYHDLGEQFCSPTINMKFEPNGFVNFVANLPDSLNWKISFISSDKAYPVGFVGGSFVEFVHYKNQQEVLEKWNQRKLRVNMANTYLIACDDGMTLENIKAFDDLPYNKVIFSSRKYTGIKSNVVIDCFSKADARLLNFSDLRGGRYYEKYFNCVEWLNLNAK